jgi:hypothetical protein
MAEKETMTEKERERELTCIERPRYEQRNIAPDCKKEHEI